jgi:hypothetical protein
MLKSCLDELVIPIALVLTIIVIFHFVRLGLEFLLP